MRKSKTGVVVLFVLLLLLLAVIFVLRIMQDSPNMFLSESQTVNGSTELLEDYLSVADPSSEDQTGSSGLDATMPTPQSKLPVVTPVPTIFEPMIIEGNGELEILIPEGQSSAGG